MYLVVFNILIYSLYIFIISKKNLNILQQHFYNENNRYIKWGFKNINNVFRLDMLLLLINFINVYIKSVYIILLNVFYLLLFLYEYKKYKNKQVKIPFKNTNRIKRLIITLIIIYIIPIIVIFCKNGYLFYSIYSLFISVNYFIIWLANLINKPIEKFVFLYYKGKAINKIKNLNNLKVVGITGSYGKTSTKNILNNILSVKYNSITTPKNFNTGYGLIITINNYLDKFNDVFIAEMGAFKRGRIKKLCDLVKPKYGIITCIGEVHLETFGNRKNIQKGKFELIESLPSDGVGILNMDDEYQVNYKIKNNVKIIWVAINNKDADLYANNIVMNMNGMKFDVCFKKENIIYEFSTKLLGYNNIYNILAGIAFSKYIMNMDLESISLGVNRIKPIEHRLEIKNRGKYTIIDDAYNSNPVGSKMALDVLHLMDGEKIVITPGMIELGSEQYEKNRIFGEYISKVADYVILVGEKQTKPILDGLLNKEFNRDNIKIINDVKKAFYIIDNMKIDKHAYILLENDLPDIFNE